MLKVRGNSMIDVGIYDGDRVIVEQTSVAENGEIVVALIDDSATVKRFFKENGHYRLQPENATMDPIIVDKSTDSWQSNRSVAPYAVTSWFTDAYLLLIIMKMTEALCGKN